MNNNKTINYNDHYPFFGLLLITETVLYLIWGLMINYLFPTYHDPLWIRIVLVLFYFIVVYYQKTKIVEKHKHFLVLFFVYFFMVHLSLLNYINNDPVLYSTILVPGAIIMGTFTYDLRSVIMWCLCACGFAGYSYYLYPSANNAIIICYFMTCSVVAVVACMNEQRSLAVHAAKMSTIGEIAAGVAHEVNNPLAIINGHVDKISKEIDRENDVEEIRKSITKIKKATYRARNIVEALGNFSLNTVNEKSEKVSMNSVLDETLALGRTRIHSSGVKLEVNLFTEDVYVDVNHVDLSQVILNLIINSYDAVVDTEMPWINISLKCDEKKVYLVITDSGTGIDQKIVEKYKGTLSYVPLNGHTSFVVELPRA